MKKTPAILCIVAVASLAACSGVKKELGIGRNSPDEFMVVKRAPLTLPPEYDLRPPSTDTVAPASEIANQAKATLMGSTGTEAAKGSADNALLSKMGAENADPNVRAQINRENGFIELENRTLVDKLIFWKDQNAAAEDAPASVVNPKEEAERLKKNQAEGKPANEGDVPVIEKKRSTIEKLF